MDLSPASASLSPPVAASVARALYRRSDDVTTPQEPAAAASRQLPIRPESLHPTLWLGHQLARHADAAVATGFAALDAQLPGAGWPRRALTELLLPHPGVGEIRLLAPSLVAAQRAGRLVMLFDPPAPLAAVALERLGFTVEELLIINTRARVIPGADSLWALEQALKSGHVGAVLAWLPPRLRAERLRRLQLAAHAHDGPAFVLCEMSAAQRPTAAPLRLALRPAGADALAVRVLKRRGPPLEAPLQLALPPVLSEAARQRAQAGIAALRRGGVQPATSRGLRAATFVNLAAG
jgi:protein ImuA